MSFSYGSADELVTRLSTARHWDMRRVITLSAALALAPALSAAQENRLILRDSTVVNVRFATALGVRLQQGELRTSTGLRLEMVHAVLSRHGLPRIDPLFTLPEPRLERLRGAAADRSGRTPPDLGSWHRLYVPATANLEQLLADLNALPEVDTAYVAPRPAPPPRPPARQSPDFTSRQTYFGPAPLGTDAEFARAAAGGAGADIKVVDLEYDWFFEHEDLGLDESILLGGQRFNFFRDDHGTAVLGVLYARDNGIGVTGGVPDAAIQVVSPCVTVTPEFCEYNGANAISIAGDNMQPGDVLLVEQQARGPNDDGDDNNGCECVPLEWDLSVFDATLLLTQAGTIVVAAAGNGNQNLDAPEFEGRFDRSLFDSGAIIVGAGDSLHARLGFSTYGSRVDLQGWGANVTTTGYGDLFGASNVDFYTAGFGGTSSASPIVAAAAAAVEGFVKAETGTVLSSADLGNLLKDTGTPQTGNLAENIGPFPNVRAALEQLGAEPLMLAVSPPSRADSAIAGDTEPLPDSATVTLTGTGAATATWSATKGAAPWNTLNTAAGTGSGMVRWTRDPSGLAEGTYVDTITVTAAGAEGSPATVIDTLVILPPLTLAVSPSSRVDSAIAGDTEALPDSATVTLSGTGAATATWSATKGAASWNILTTAAGTGSGMVRWTRDPSGLAEGTYLDTITVTAAGAAGSPATVIDTLVILPPLTLAVSPSSRADSAIDGDTEALPDSATVTLTGTGAATATWSATKGAAPWNTLTTAAGTGSGMVRWTRDPSGLNEGTYVDTIAVTAPGAAGSPATVIDTLVILPPLVLAVSPPSRADSAIAGDTETLPDSAAVTLTGTGAATATWSATKGAAAWNTLTTAAGTGSGMVRWTRDPSGLVEGTYLDTVTVTAPGAAGSPATVIDTLVILPPLMLAVSPSSETDSAIAGDTEALPDSATVTLTGTGAATAAWSVTKGAAPWNTLTTAAGTGSGMVHWTRDPSGLAEGTYVDTITVTAADAAGSPATVIDTLVILPPLTLAVSPSSRADSAIAGETEAVPDSATVTLTGTGAATAWTATNGAAPWNTLTTAAGTGSGVVRWTRDPSGLAEATYVDTITVSVAGAAGSPATVIDTLVILPPLMLAVSPSSQADSAIAGDTEALPDSATVTLTGTGAATATWSATKGAAPWNTLTTAAGTGSGMVRWTRDPSGLAAGTYVDTITVTAADAAGSPATVIDTLVILPPLVLAVDPLSRSALTMARAGEVLDDSAAVTLTGTGADTANWTATHGGGEWLTLTTAGGIGSGLVRWTRDPGNLDEGTYVDTIVVTSDHAFNAVAVVDSLVAVAPVEVTDAAGQLLGGSGLNENQRRFLDARGNRDGEYNLGDFLAYLDRAALVATRTRPRDPPTPRPDRPVLLDRTGSKEQR